MLRLPPLISLRAFEASARHLSFKSAAKELGVTPTAISHQIRVLEQFCGQPLFRRQPRPLALTAAGEQLFPVFRDGFRSFAQALNAFNSAPANPGLRVSTTSAFAARWLMPRLPRWRKAHPGIPLDIISTYDVLDLNSDADIAIRYARSEPADGIAFELLRDRFHVVGSPMLVGEMTGPIQPDDIAKFPLIETGWPSADTEAPTWHRWERKARAGRASFPCLTNAISLRFEEEVHAIEAVISGHGLAICSDVLVADELASGKLLRMSQIILDGYGFYLVHRRQHPKQAQIAAFLKWAKAEA